MQIHLISWVQDKIHSVLYYKERLNKEQYSIIWWTERNNTQYTDSKEQNDKEAVKENTRKNITNVSNVKEVWNCINDILKPENVTKTTIKIETKNQIFEDPQELAKKFNSFFKEKIEKLAGGIKKMTQILTHFWTWEKKCTDQTCNWVLELSVKKKCSEF